MFPAAIKLQRTDRDLKPISQTRICLTTECLSAICRRCTEVF